MGLGLGSGLQKCLDVDTDTGHELILKTVAHLRRAGVGGALPPVVKRVQPGFRSAGHQRGGIVQQCVEPVEIVRPLVADERRAAVILCGNRGQHSGACESKAAEHSQHGSCLLLRQLHTHSHAEAFKIIAVSRHMYLNGHCP